MSPAALIRGFAVESPEETMEGYKIKVQNVSENQPVIEEDQVVRSLISTYRALPWCMEADELANR